MSTFKTAFAIIPGLSFPEVFSIVARPLRCGLPAGSGGPWPLMYALIVVPAPIRDLVYRLIASYRYRWFGRAEVCRVPTPQLQARFIE